jgi:hypothetical protein
LVGGQWLHKTGSDGVLPPIALSNGVFFFIKQRNCDLHLFINSLAISVGRPFSSRVTPPALIGASFAGNFSKNPTIFLFCCAQILLGIGVTDQKQEHPVQTYRCFNYVGM